MFIGDQDLASILVDNAGNRVFIDDRTTSVAIQTDLSVVKINADEYYEMVLCG